MKKKLPGNLSEILRFKERISVKNRQLLMLKRLSLMLLETEDEDTFVQNTVPFIKKTLNIKGDLIIYIETEGKPTSVIGFDKDALQSLYASIKDVITPKESPVVVDLTPEEDGDPLGFYIKQGYSKCIISSVYEKSKTIGFLGIPRERDYILQEDEKIFIRHLGEIIGIFFDHINLKRNLRETKTQMQNQYQDLQAVYTVSRSLGGYLDTNTILNNALDTLLSQEVLNIEAKGGIFLLNEETNRLELICHRNIEKYILETEKTIDMGYCLCGRVAQAGGIITSLNCFTDKRHETQFKGMTLHGHINLPLKTDERVLGVLFLYLPGNVEPTENQMNLLTAIANQLSVALENARLYERVSHLSVHDPLTNLFNRKMLFDRLDEEVSRSKRSEKFLSIVMIDIDNFKRINDTYGHMAGDKILQELSKLLKSGIRKIDTVARFGGEEFTILLPSANMEDGIAVMERLRLSVEKHAFPIDEEGNTTSVTISIGISTLSPEDPVDKSILINAADEALYKAKEKGRNRICHLDVSECIPFDVNNRKPHN